jgi:hypothetical protein
MKNNLAPILLFTYKRLDALRITVAALKANSLAKDSDLFIFSDNSKSPDDDLTVSIVRAYIRTIEGFKSITIYESDVNKGLATSIIEGVTTVLSRYENVIVLEDDLSTTQNFLSFMNSCLHTFQEHDKVFSISGYAFNLGLPNKKAEVNDGYFLNRGWSWGWATWKDRWEKVDWNVNDYSVFANDRLARRAFAEGGSDLNKMLTEQMSGMLDSWAIRWFYHQFKIGGLTFYPVFSKVFNNGFDRLATHTNGSNRRYIPVLDNGLNERFDLLEAVAINAVYQARFKKKMGYLARIISKIETFFKADIKWE